MRVVFKTAAGGAAALALAAAGSSATAAPPPWPAGAQPAPAIGLAAMLPAAPPPGSRRPLILSRPPVAGGGEGRGLAADFSPSAPARSPTSVDYRLARDGPHGSLGYICLDGLAPIAPREAAVTAGTDGGRMIGGSFLIPLR